MSVKIKSRIEPSCLSQMEQFCKGAKLNRVGWFLRTSVTPYGYTVDWNTRLEEKRGKLSKISNECEKHIWTKYEPSKSFKQG